MTLCSLGPHDCIHVMNGRVVTSGWLAAQLKHQVEVTKMGEMRQETWWNFGDFMWRFPIGLGYPKMLGLFMFISWKIPSRNG